MCGIVGFRAEKSFQSLCDDLPCAVSTLANRGPDDSGLFFDQKNDLGMGHRRLSVIDLSPNGRQPMSSDDGSVHIVYNGEVYNFMEIRNILEGCGHSFKGVSDTEVILKAYLQWGIDCLKRFVGMFALAIWDRRKQQLFLARDRLGIKPLYYYYNAGKFIFASELKALMAFRSFPKEINSNALPLFLHYQYIPAPETVFRNTFKLLPGQYIIYKFKDLRVKSYWELPCASQSKNRLFTDEPSCLDSLDDVLTQAVSDRLISDVPLGALLSGGIDSSVVVALMQKISTSPVNTFCIGFEEQAYNEAPWAKKVAQYLGTDHTELYVSSKESLETVASLPEIYDEPFADSSAIPTVLLSRLTRSQVTVALSGDGGDEQFAGYVRYWMTRTMVNSFSRLPVKIKKALALILNTIPPELISSFYYMIRSGLPQRFQVANFVDKWQKLLSQLEKTSIAELYRMTINIWPKDMIEQLCGRKLPHSSYERLFSGSKNEPLLERLMRIDQKTYLPDDLLTKVDRASMAFGLEVRTPLLDHRVLEFCSCLPENLKFKNGTGKYLLKKLLARYLPQNLYERPKMGFGVPVEHWLRTDLKEMLQDYLSPAKISKDSFFCPNLVEKMLKEHISGKFNHQHRLWGLLMWQMWWERWMMVKISDGCE